MILLIQSAKVAGVEGGESEVGRCYPLDPKNHI